MVSKPKLLTALNKSIAKWKRIAGNIYHSEGSPCGLCEIFMDNKPNDLRCKGCPLHDFEKEPAECCWEWQMVHQRINDLIERLKKERAKLVDP